MDVTKLKTKEELKERGYKHITTMHEGKMIPVEIWAKFSGFQDVVNYVYHVDGVFTGDIQTISYNMLMMHEKLVVGLKKEGLLLGIIKNIAQVCDDVDVNLL